MAGPAARRPHLSARSIRRRALASIGLLSLAVLLAATWSLWSAARATTAGLDHVDAAFASARDGDLPEAGARLRAAEGNFQRAQGLAGGLWVAPLRRLPVVSAHIRALDGAAAAGEDLAATGDALVGTADLRSLTDGTGRFDVERARELAGAATTAADALDRAGEALDAIDRRWLLAPASSAVDRRGRQIDQAATDADDARRILDVLPAIGGDDGQRRYLVAFLNNAEQRGLGGLWGNFAELLVDDGELTIGRSGSTKLIEAMGDPEARHLVGLDDYEARYGRYDVEHFLRDASFSPDLPSSAQAMAQLAEQSGFGPIDGVIALDVHALAAILELTGPVTVDGLDEPLTTANAIEVLLRDQYLELPDDAERKDVLDEATRRTFDALVTRPLPSPWQLTQALGPIVGQRRLGVWMARPDEQAVVHHVGLDGALPTVEAGSGDVLAIAHQNAGNDKIDAFLHRRIRQRTTLDAATGTVTSRVEVGLRNDAPASGLPAYVIGNPRGLPDGTNIMNLTVWSTLDLHGASLDGEPLVMEVGAEAGLRAYSTRIEIAPGTTAVLSLDLRGGADLSDGTWRTTYVPQPSANPDDVGVDIRATGGRAALDGATHDERSGTATSAGDPIELRGSDLERLQTWTVLVRRDR